MCALDIAAKEGRLRCLEALLSLGAAADCAAQPSTSSGGAAVRNTPLHFAAMGGSAPCVEALLRAGASCHEVNSGGYSPLHWAAGNATADCTLLLLAAGASPHLCSRRGDTPLHMAARADSAANVTALLDHTGGAFGAETTTASGEAVPSPLQLAVLGGCAAAAAALLLRGAARAVAPPLGAESIGNPRNPPATEETAPLILFAGAPMPEETRRRTGPDKAARRATGHLAKSVVSALRGTGAGAAALEAAVARQPPKPGDPLDRLRTLRSLRPPFAAAAAAAAEESTSDLYPFSRILLEHFAVAVATRVCAAQAETEAAVRTIGVLQQWLAASSGARGRGAGGGSNRELDMLTYAAARCVAKWADVKDALQAARRCDELEQFILERVEQVRAEGWEELKKLE